LPSLKQTAQYLSRFGLEQGYLILFETIKTIFWDKRIYRKELQGKKILLFGM